MANNIINGVTTENTPKFTNEDIEKIREKLKENNSNNLGADGKMINDSGVQVITLKDCIDIVNGFIEGKVSADELEEFGNRMTIRSYIPLLEKMSILMNMMLQYEISNVDSLEIKITEFYKFLFFKVVLSSYGQIYINEFDKKDVDLMSYENYDKLFPLFNQYILTYCQDDYNIFVSMLKDCISWSGVVSISENLESIDTNNIDKITEENKKLMDNLKENSQLVESMKDLLLATDNQTEQIITHIKQATVRDVLEQGKDKLEQKVIADEQQKNNVVDLSTVKKRRGRPPKNK